MVDVLSYGGGHQTAGMLAMIKLGKLPRPDIIVFADTGGEIPETYHHLEHYGKPFAEELGIPFITAQFTRFGKVETLEDFSLRYKWIPQPFQRTCTNQFKIQVIHKELRKYKGKEPVNVWIGISTDEAHRRKESRVKWLNNVYPLIDNGISRKDCDYAMVEVGMPIPPKSGCFFCPFANRERWRVLRKEHPDLFQRAITMEDTARTRNTGMTLSGKSPLRTWLEGEQLAWEELLEAEEGCHTGYCFV
jgi:hypothetical protein